MISRAKGKGRIEYISSRINGFASRCPIWELCHDPVLDLLEEVGFILHQPTCYVRNVEKNDVLLVTLQIVMRKSSS